MHSLEDSMLRKTVLSAAMLLARNDVEENGSARQEGMFQMTVDGIDHPGYQAIIVKEEDEGHDFFSILAYQGDFGSKDERPSIWLSVNADAAGTYAIHKRLSLEGAWALYNDAEGAGFNFFSSDPKMNKGFVSLCGAITITNIDLIDQKISGHFQ